MTAPQPPYDPDASVPTPCDHRDAEVSDLCSGHAHCPCGAVGQIVTRVEWPNAPHAASSAQDGAE